MIGIAKKLKSAFSPRDMTVGPPWRRMAEFAVPMLVGNLAQQLYNTADSIIVGKYIGDNALAAVGSASPILNLLLALFVGVATGAGILVAQSYGAGDRERLSRTIGNCLTLTVFATLAIMLVGTLITRPLLELLDTPASIIDWCESYLKVFFIGVAGFFFYNIFAGILRGMGDSLSALLFLLIATALNVGLDIWFVSFMGVPGVALATVIAQGISAVLCAIKLAGMRHVIDFGFKQMRPRKEYVMGIVKLGVPSGITQAIFSLAMLVVQSLTNSFGEMVIACNVIVMRVDGFAMMPNMTFGNTLTTFTGQNYGAKRFDRVRQGAKQGTLMAVGVSTLLTLIILVFGRYLMDIFTDTPELVGMSVHMMRILAVGYIAVAVSQSLSGVMRGSGNTLTPMWISFFTTIAIRVPLAYTIAYFTRSELYPTGRPESTFISLLCSWSLGAVITAAVYLRGRKRTPEHAPLSDARAA